MSARSTGRVARSRIPRLLAVVCAGGLLAGALSMWRTPPVVQVVDRNHDGRPDEWRFFDDQGHLRRVSIDNNYDGRSDEQDYYDEAGLIRRELDRNRDDRVDEIENYARDTHLRTRVVLDEDFNGTADLLILYQNGSPVFSESLANKGSGRPASVAPRSRGGAELLAPLVDPFSTDVAIDAAPANPTNAGAAAFDTLTGVPEAVLQIVARLAPSRAGPLVLSARPCSTVRSLHPTRGPPSFLIV